MIFGQGHQMPCDSGEEEVLLCFTMYKHGGHLGHVLAALSQTCGNIGYKYLENR